MAAQVAERYYVSYDGSFRYTAGNIDADRWQAQRDKFVALVSFNVGVSERKVKVKIAITDRPTRTTEVGLKDAKDYFDSISFVVENIVRQVHCTIFVGDIDLYTILIMPLYTTNSLVVREGTPLSLHVDPLPDLYGPMLWVKYQPASLENYQQIVRKIIETARTIQAIYPVGNYNYPDKAAGLGRANIVKSLVENFTTIDSGLTEWSINAFFFGVEAFGADTTTETYLEAISQANVKRILNISAYEANPDEPKVWLMAALYKMASLITRGHEAFSEILVYKFLVEWNHAFGLSGQKEFEMLESESPFAMDFTLSKPTGSFTMIGYQRGTLGVAANNGNFSSQDYTGYETGFADQDVWTLRNITKVACLEDRRIIRKPFNYEQQVEVREQETWPYAIDPSVFNGQPSTPELVLFKTEGNYEDKSFTVQRKIKQDTLPLLHSNESGVYAFAVSPADEQRYNTTLSAAALFTKTVDKATPVDSRTGGNLVYVITREYQFFDYLFSPFLLSVSPISRTIKANLGETLTIDFRSSFSALKPPPGSLTWSKNDNVNVVSLDNYKDRLVVAFPRATEEQAGLYQLSVNTPPNAGNIHEILEVVVDLALRCVRCDKEYTALGNHHGACRFHSRHPADIATAYENTGFSLVKYVKERPEAISAYYNSWLQKEFRLLGKAITQDKKASLLAQLMIPGTATSAKIYRHLPLRDTLEAVISEEQTNFHLVDDCRIILQNLSYVEPWLRRSGYRADARDFDLHEFADNLTLAQYESLPITVASDRQWLNGLLKSVRPSPGLALERFDSTNPLQAQPVYGGKTPVNPNIHFGVIAWATGQADGPRWACCLQPSEALGCYVGRHNSVTTIPDLSDWLHNSPRRGTEYIFDPNTSNESFVAIREAYAEHRFAEGIRLEAAFNRIHGGEFTLGFTFLNPKDASNDTLLESILTEEQLSEKQLVLLLGRVNLDFSFGLWKMRRVLQLDYTVPRRGDLTPRTPGLPGSGRTVRALQLLDAFQKLRHITPDDRKRSLQGWIRTGIVATVADILDYSPEVIEANRLLNDTILSYITMVNENTQLVAESVKEVQALKILEKEIENDPQISAEDRELLEIQVDLDFIEAGLAKATETITTSPIDTAIIQEQRLYLDDLIVEMHQNRTPPGDVLFVTRALVNDIYDNGVIPPNGKKIVSGKALEEANVQLKAVLAQLQQVHTDAAAGRLNAQTDSTTRYNELKPHLVEFLKAGKKLFDERTVQFENNGIFSLLRDHKAELKALNRPDLNEILQEVDTGEFRLKITDDDLLNTAVQSIYDGPSSAVVFAALSTDSWTPAGNAKYKQFVIFLDQQTANPSAVLDLIFPETDIKKLNDAFNAPANERALIRVVKANFGFLPDAGAQELQQKLQETWAVKAKAFQLEKGVQLLASPELKLVHEDAHFLGDPEFKWQAGQTMDLLEVYAYLQRADPEEVPPAAYIRLFNFLVPLESRVNLTLELQELEKKRPLIEAIKVAIGQIKKTIDESGEATFQRAVKIIREAIMAQGGKEIFAQLEAELAARNPAEYDIDKKLDEMLLSDNRRLSPIWQVLILVTGALPSKTVDVGSEEGGNLMKILTDWFAARVDISIILEAELKKSSLSIKYDPSDQPSDLLMVQKLLGEHQSHVLKELETPTTTGNWIVSANTNWTTNPADRDALRNSVTSLYTGDAIQTALLNSMTQFLSLLLSGDITAFDYLQTWLSDTAEKNRKTREKLVKRGDSPGLARASVKNFISELQKELDKLRALYPRDLEFRKSLISLIFGFLDQIYTRTSLDAVRSWQFIHWQDPYVSKRYDWQHNKFSTLHFLNNYLVVNDNSSDALPDTYDVQINDHSTAVEVAGYELAVLQHISPLGFPAIKQKIENALSLRDLGLSFNEIEGGARDQGAFFDPLRHLVMAVVLLHKNEQKLPLNPVWEKAFSTWATQGASAAKIVMDIWEQTKAAIVTIEEILDVLEPGLSEIQKVLEVLRADALIKSTLVAAIGNPLLLRPLILADTRAENASNLRKLENWDTILSYPLLKHPRQFHDLTVNERVGVNVFQFLAIAINASEHKDQRTKKYRHQEIGTYLHDVCVAGGNPDVLAYFVHSFHFGLPFEDISDEATGLLAKYQRKYPFATDLAARSGMLRSNNRKLKFRCTPGGFAKFLSESNMIKTPHTAVDISHNPKTVYGLHQAYQNLLGDAWATGMEVWKLISNNAISRDRTRVPLLVTDSNRNVTDSSIVVVKQALPSSGKTSIDLATDPDTFKEPEKQDIYIVLGFKVRPTERRSIERIFTDSIHRDEPPTETFAILETTPSVRVLEMSFELEVKTVRAALAAKAGIVALQAQAKLKEMEKEFEDGKNVAPLMESMKDIRVFFADTANAQRLAKLAAMVTALPERVTDLFPETVVWLARSVIAETLAEELEKLVAADGASRQELADHYASFVTGKDVSSKDAVLHKAVLEEYRSSTNKTGPGGNRAHLVALVFTHREKIVTQWLNRLTNITAAHIQEVTNQQRLESFDIQLAWLHANNWPSVKATDEIKTALTSESLIVFDDSYKFLATPSKLDEITKTLFRNPVFVIPEHLKGLDDKIVEYLKRSKFQFNASNELEFVLGENEPQIPGAREGVVIDASKVFRAVRDLAVIFYIREVLIGSKAAQLMDLRAYLEGQAIHEGISGLAKMLLKYSDAAKRSQSLDGLIYYAVFMEEITKAFTPEAFIRAWLKSDGSNEEPDPSVLRFFSTLAQASSTLTQDLLSPVRDAIFQKSDTKRVRAAAVQTIIRDVWSPSYLNFFTKKLSVVYGPQFDSILSEYKHFHELKLTLQATIYDEDRGGFRFESLDERYFATLRGKIPLTPRANWKFEITPPGWAKRWIAAPSDVSMDDTVKENEPAVAALFNTLISKMTSNTIMSLRIDEDPRYKVHPNMGDQVQYLFNLEGAFTLKSEELQREPKTLRDLTSIIAEIESDPVPLLPLVTMDIYASPGVMTKDVQLLTQIAKWEVNNKVKIYSSRYTDLDFDNLRQRSKFKELSQPDVQLVIELRNQLMQRYTQLGLFLNLPAPKFERMFNVQDKAALAHLKLEYYFWFGKPSPPKYSKLFLERDLKALYDDMSSSLKGGPDPLKWMRPAILPMGIYRAELKDFVTALNSLNTYAAELLSLPLQDRPLKFFVDQEKKDKIASTSSPEKSDVFEYREFFVPYAVTPYLSMLTDSKIASAFISDFILAFLRDPIYTTDLPTALQTVTDRPTFEVAGAKNIRSTRKAGGTGQESTIIPTAVNPTNPVGLHLYIVVKRAPRKDQDEMVGWALWDTSSQNFQENFGDSFTSTGVRSPISTTTSAELVYLYTRLTTAEGNGISGLGNALMSQGILDARWINNKTSFITEASQSAEVLPARPDDEGTRELVAGVPRLYFPIKGNLIKFYGKFGFKIAFPDKHTVMPGLTRPGRMIGDWADSFKEGYQIMSSPQFSKGDKDDAYLFYQAIANVLTVAGPERPTVIANSRKLKEFVSLKAQSEEAAKNGPPGHVVRNISLYDVGNPPDRQMIPHEDIEQEWYPPKVTDANPAYTQALLFLPNVDRFLQDITPEELLKAEVPGEKRPPRLQSILDWKTAAVLFKTQYLGNTMF
jgi:hypothetical protein